jgi:hypothetical protein
MVALKKAKMRDVYPPFSAGGSFFQWTHIMTALKKAQMRDIYPPFSAGGCLFPIDSEVQN